MSMYYPPQILDQPTPLPDLCHRPCLYPVALGRGNIHTTHTKYTTGFLLNLLEILFENVNPWKSLKYTFQSSSSKRGWSATHPLHSHLAGSSASATFDTNPRRVSRLPRLCSCPPHPRNVCTTGQTNHYRNSERRNEATSPYGRN